MKFTKMHALGNDFVVLNGFDNNLPAITESLVKKMADRHTGIGFDQLLICYPPKSDNHDAEYVIYNADGSLVGQCGNGARAIARFIVEESIISKSTIILKTNTTSMTVNADDLNNIAANLGQPNWSAPDLPKVDLNNNKSIWRKLPEEIIKLCPTPSFITANRLNNVFAAVNVGNPHAIIPISSESNLNDFPVAIVGQAMSQHHLFPEGANINFVQVNSRQQLSLRVYERGAGETQACGSGATATAAALRQAGLTDEKVSISLKGGCLQVCWLGGNNDLWLIGPAQRVYDGQWIKT